MLSGFVQVLTSALGTKDQLAKLEAFFADKDTAGYNQALEQSKDSIKSRISYVDRDVQDVTAWLKANGYMA
jgi:aminopeptidase 2